METARIRRERAVPIFIIAREKFATMSDDDMKKQGEALTQHLRLTDSKSGGSVANARTTEVG
jgi:hypothetical protein